VRPYPLRGDSDVRSAPEDGSQSPLVYNTTGCPARRPGTQLAGPCSTSTHGLCQRGGDLHLAESVDLHLFDPSNRDGTVSALVDSQGGSRANAQLDRAGRRRLTDAEARLRCYPAAIEAGAEPATLVDAMNQAHAEHTSARAELDSRPAMSRLMHHEVDASAGAVATSPHPQGLLSLGRQGGPPGDAQPTCSPQPGQVRL